MSKSSQARFEINKKNLYLFRTLSLQIALLLIAVVMLFPFLWMILSSFKPAIEQAIFPPTILPKVWTWENYQSVSQYIDFARVFFNTGVYVFVKVFAVIFFCSLAGFVFAKMRFPLRKELFLLIIATMIWPLFIRIGPLYSMMVKLHWVNTYQGLLAPALIGPFLLFFFRQGIISIPTSLIDAARTDGLSWFGVYWRIVLPNIRATLGAALIIDFMWTWQDLLWPLIIINSKDLFILEMAISGLRYLASWATSDSAFVFAEYGVVMAGATISVLPVIIIYLILQTQFMKSFTMSGLKG